MKTLPVVAACLALSAPTWAQESPITPTNLDTVHQRYTEGTTAQLFVPIVQGCLGNNQHDQSEPVDINNTSDAIVVFPNDTDISAYAYSQGADSTQYGANALMAIQPRVSRSFGLILQKQGSVPAYYNRGEQSEDVRVIHWAYGLIPGNQYENLEYRAALPKLKGCVKNLKVYTPLIQFCGTDVQASLKEPTNRFPEAVIASGSVPFFEVVRDLHSNPLDQDCGAGETKSVYPSASSIDTFAVKEIVMIPVEPDGGNGSGGEPLPPPIGDVGEASHPFLLPVEVTHDQQSTDNDEWDFPVDPDGTEDSRTPSLPNSDETPIPVDGGDGTGVGEEPIPFIGSWLN